jgi:5-methylcytosine-specific restriction enzyme A
MKPQKTPRIPLAAAVRAYVFERDQYTCRVCGSKENLAIDHIIPLAQGGTNDISNFQTLCQTCNGRKGDRIISDMPRHFSSD